MRPRVAKDGDWRQHEAEAVLLHVCRARSCDKKDPITFSHGTLLNGGGRGGETVLHVSSMGTWLGDQLVLGLHGSFRFVVKLVIAVLMQWR